MKRTLAVGLALVLAAGACGTSQEEKQKEEAAKQAEQAGQTAGQAANQAAKGLEEMAKGLQALAGGNTGDQKPVDPVSFKDLQTVFPDLAGWEKAKPTGERMTSPFPFSNAEVSYTKGDSRIQLKITDTGFNQLMLTPYAMVLAMGYEKETSDGYEKSTKVNGQPGWEKWNSESKNGEVNAVVGKRFLVQIEGSDISDTKVLHDIAGKIDMGKLASLK